MHVILDGRMALGTSHIREKGTRSNGPCRQRRGVLSKSDGRALFKFERLKIVFRTMDQGSQF